MYHNGVDALCGQGPLNADGLSRVMGRHDGVKEGGGLKEFTVSPVRTAGDNQPCKLAILR